MDPIKKNALIIAAIAVLATAVIGALSFLTLRSSQKPEPSPSVATSPSPAQATPSTDPCKDFETLAYAAYPISCKTAVDLALEQAPGTVRNISIGNVRTSVPTNSGIERRNVEMWLIDIELDNPYFDETFNRQIRVLQIGTPTEEQNVFYQKPLE